MAVLNLAYFGVEFAVALAIRSVSLFADSIDFLEDASVNFLILVALGWDAHAGREWAWRWPVSCSSLAWPPSGRPGGSSPCRRPRRCRLAGRCRRPRREPLVRDHAGLLPPAPAPTRGLPLGQERPLANVAIIATDSSPDTRSAWPDLIVGLGIALMNADAAREVYGAAREEHRAASA